MTSESRDDLDTIEHTVGGLFIDLFEGLSDVALCDGRSQGSCSAGETEKREGKFGL